MNIKRTGMFGLTALLLCLTSPFIASPASAQAYTCATVPSVVLGEVTIDEPGDCTIGHSVTADGNIIIKAVGNISVQALNSGYSVWLESSDGTITTNNEAINTNSVGNGGNLLLVADGNISTGDLDTHSRGGIEIVANKGGGSTLFSIGSASANGVNGSLKSVTTTYGGTDPTDHVGGIFVTNGDSASTGGITIATADNIQIRTNASASRTGLLILNAQNGPLTLPTGSLSADGGTNQMAGSVYLMAKTINTVDGTIITASQSLSATGTNRCVCISAETVNVAGASGLQLLSNGNGSQADGGQLSLLPKGSITVASNGDYEIMNWVSNGSQQFITHAPMTVTGNAPLFASANGNNTRAQVSGYPMTFSNSAVTIQSRGVTSHRVIMGYNGALNGTTQLAFTGTGNVNIDANGLAGAGGEVTIYGDKMTFDSPIINISANGPAAANQNGNGGTVYIASTAATLKATSKFTVTANAASQGSGNAIHGEIGTGQPKAIQFFPGAVSLNVGTANGQYSFQANGGKTGGNGGTIYMGASSLALKTADAIDASAWPISAGGSGNGDGGEIYLNNYITVDAAARVNAIGKGTGNGGKFTAFYFNPGIPMDVNRVVKVDGGDSRLTTAEQDFGRIKINTTTCQQRTTNLAPWPKTFWNCQHPDSASTAADQRIYTGADKLHGVTKGALDTAKIQIYIMTDINAFKDFHGLGPVNTLGVQGYSEEELKVSAVFFQMIMPIPLLPANTSAYYSGTIIHEMSHQLNYWTWGHKDSTNATWLGHFNTATTTFDTPGLPPPAANNCLAVVDADRTDPTVARPAICTRFDGVTINPINGLPYPFKKNSVGLAAEGGEAWFLEPEERFANAFAASYRRLYPLDIAIDIYNTKIENRLGDEHTYMDNVRDTGAPAP